MEAKITQLKETLEDIMRPTKERVHGQETLDWLLKIEPGVDWQLEIAAFAHDIERAVPYIVGMTPKSPSTENGVTYDDYKKAHAQRSAELVRHIMLAQGFEEKDIARVTNAIALHEVGGDADSDLVRDADSIRWFDVGYKKYIESYGVEGACEKGWWMYNRATTSSKKLIDSLEFDKTVKDYIKKQQ